MFIKSLISDNPNSNFNNKTEENHHLVPKTMLSNLVKLFDSSPINNQGHSGITGDEDEEIVSDFE